MKIVVLDGHTLNPGDLDWKGLEALGELTVYPRTPYEDDQIVTAIADAEVVLTNKTPLCKAVLEQRPNLRYIGVLATGYNVVDVQAAKELGIVVSNVPSYGTVAVAQFTMALLLEMCHHVGAHNGAVHKGDWSRSPDFCFWDYPLIELDGKTMGIVGYGRIGQAVARLALAFGMRVLTTGSRHVPEPETDRIHYVDEKTLFAESDVISLHCPLTEQTQGLINRESMAGMKPGVLLLNTSRGGLIVEKDLKEALEHGHIGGAAVDVVSEEPIKTNNPLLGAPNCIITPHIAWASKAARERLMDTVTENLKAFLADKPQNVVNP